MRVTHHSALDSSPRVPYTRNTCVDTAAELEFPLTVATLPRHADSDGQRFVISQETRVRATEWLKDGQTRLELGMVPRQAHPTGVQVPCVLCAQRGIVKKQGLPRDATGDPLCIPCWRTRQDKARLRESRELEALAWLDAYTLPEAGCAVCGSEEENRECWLCGHQWIVQLRREHELDQAAEQAEIDAKFAALAEIAEAEGREADVKKLLAWHGDVVAAFPDGRVIGRPVVLLADILASLEAARTTSRGRPPEAQLLIIALMLMEAHWRNGRRCFPGRDRIVWLLGCSPKTVTNTWKMLTERRLAMRTRQGRRLSLKERRELQRANDRAEYDFRPLNRSPHTSAQRDAHIATALRVLAALGVTLTATLKATQEELDGLRERAGTWTDYPERAERAKIASRAAQTVATLTATADDIDTNNYPPSSGTNSEYVSSCLSGVKQNQPKFMIHCRYGVRPDGRGKDQSGASRSPTRAGVSDLERLGRSQPVGHPRTVQATRPPSQRKRRQAPEWAWAYDLARDLRKQWDWLAGENLRMLAATLGSRLGPNWTAPVMVAWIMAQRGGRPILTDPDHPLRYLIKLLSEALTGAAAPPLPARANVEAARAAAETRAADLRKQRAEQAATAQAYAGIGSDQRGSGASAAVAAFRAKMAGRQPGDSVECEWPAVAPVPGPPAHR